MPTSTANARRRVTPSLLYLWFFLTLATIGFAVMMGGVWKAQPGWIAAGGTLMAFATLTFLFLQFWTTGVRAAPSAAPWVSRSMPSAAVPRAASASPFGFISKLPQPTTAAVRPDDLVEFETVPQAPTSLELPGAFSTTLHAEASAETGSRVPSPMAAIFGREDFVPAVERRQEIVAGLPLVASILAEGPEPHEAETVPSRPGRTRGQCGGCQTFLWAPMQRPIRLRCPKCGRVSTLTE